jgi:hypothetical protein
MKLGDYTFQYKSKGILKFDPGKGTKHFQDYWCLLLLDQDICNYYSWFMNKEGDPIHPPNSLWGFHASVIKGEAPTKNIDKWGINDGKEIEFYYGNYISYSNGRHAWLNLYSEDLADLRDFYGLFINERKLKFHMTLGRLKMPKVPEPPGPTILIKEGGLVDV